MSRTELLVDFGSALASGAIRIVDLNQPLSEDTPLLVLPETFGQAAAFSRQESSRYDERGVAWHWNNFTVGEHTGTHFDAPTATCAARSGMQRCVASASTGPASGVLFNQEIGRWNTKVRNIVSRQGKLGIL